MKKLVSSNEAAQLLGLSLQGIHYRIKKGQLESVKQDGKIFVYVDGTSVKNQHTAPRQEPMKESMENALVQAKNEQIDMLKKTIKFMKKQYTSEIDRLDKNQQQILNVFQSEVDLLKSAFHEMKNVYTINHKEKNDEEFHQIGLPFMDLKDFFVFMRGYNKSDLQIKQIILDRVRSGDKRFIYKKATKEVLIFKSDFLDLI